MHAAVTGVLVALDPSEAVAAEAGRRKLNLIVTHHPLFYRPLRSLTGTTHEEQCARLLVKRNLHLYSAHTNLDAAEQGTSYALAEQLGVTNLQVLAPLENQTRKIVTFVPHSHAATVAEAMALAGAGRVGRYDHCSFRIDGTGTFRGDASARPFVGRTGTIEEVSEARLEMVASKWDIGEIVGALRRVHPYEEVAYDVYPVESGGQPHGMGVIGTLRKPVSLRGFLDRTRRSLRIPALRFTGNPASRVRTVAVCGGSGSELMGHAMQKGADVFVTADIRYHAFHTASGHMALIDAGHYETEFPVVRTLAEYLREELARRRANIPVRVTGLKTNPVNYH